MKSAKQSFVLAVSIAILLSLIVVPGTVVAQLTSHQYMPPPSYATYTNPVRQALSTYTSPSALQHQTSPTYSPSSPHHLVDDPMLWRSHHRWAADPTADWSYTSPSSFECFGTSTHDYNSPHSRPDDPLLSSLSYMSAVNPSWTLEPHSSAFTTDHHSMHAFLTTGTYAAPDPVPFAYEAMDAISGNMRGVVLQMVGPRAGIVGMAIDLALTVADIRLIYEFHKGLRPLEDLKNGWRASKLFYISVAPFGNPDVSTKPETYSSYTWRQQGNTLVEEFSETTVTHEILSENLRGEHHALVAGPFKTTIERKITTIETINDNNAYDGKSKVHGINPYTPIDWNKFQSDLKPTDWNKFQSDLKPIDWNKVLGDLEPIDLTPR